MPAEPSILLRRVFPVPPDAIEEAGKASTEVRRLLRGMGAEPEVVRRAGIVCFEGEMNIALYTKGGRIVLVVREDRVELLFSDRGPGIADIDLVKQPGYSTAPDWARELGFGAGMGIPNMEKNSDEFHIFSRVGQGTVIRATIYRRQGDLSGSGKEA